MTSGYLDSPWPAEDAGPQRPQAPRSGAGLGLRRGEALRATTRRTGGLMQGVVFPSPGWGRDFYGSSMARLARVYIA